MIEFSCCSRYAQCDYGWNKCFFEETEPSKKERCRCYQIKHNKYYKSKVESPKDLVTSQESSAKDEEHELIQLSLF